MSRADLCPTRRWRGRCSNSDARRYIVEQTETLGQVQYFAYPWQRFHADWTGDGELEAYAARLEHYGLSSQPPAGWQPKDPRTLMLPEERDAYDRAQAAGQ